MFGILYFSLWVDLFRTFDARASFIDWLFLLWLPLSKWNIHLHHFFQSIWPSKLSVCSSKSTRFLKWMRIHLSFRYEIMLFCQKLDITMWFLDFVIRLIRLEIFFLIPGLMGHKSPVAKIDWLYVQLNVVQFLGIGFFHLKVCAYRIQLILSEKILF